MAAESLGTVTPELPARLTFSLVARLLCALAIENKLAYFLVVCNLIVAIRGLLVLGNCGVFLLPRAMAVEALGTVTMIWLAVLTFTILAGCCLADTLLAKVPPGGLARGWAHAAKSLLTIVVSESAFTTSTNCVSLALVTIALVTIASLVTTIAWGGGSVVGVVSSDGCDEKSKNDSFHCVLRLCAED
jgi:hypothetical protein